MSIEEKPSGSLILDIGDDSERDSAMQGFDKCRTAKERSLDITDHQQHQALITGMGEGLEPSDTIVKENSAVEAEHKMLANEQAVINSALLSTV